MPKGWKVVARDAQTVVILHEPDFPIQQYRYCSYARSTQGFRLFAWHDDGHYLGGSASYTTFEGLARSYLLYQTITRFDSPYCGAAWDPNSSDTYVVDTSSGITKTVPEGSGQISAAVVSATGAVGSILNGGRGPCPVPGTTPGPRDGAVQLFSFQTGVSTTLDTGDPGEMFTSPPTLANLQLFGCSAGCAPQTAVLAWTHDGVWHYAPVS